MRAYEYLGPKAVTVKDINPKIPGQFYSPVLRLAKGTVFFVYVTKGKSVYFCHSMGIERIQVPIEEAKVFLQARCKISKYGTKVLEKADSLGLKVGRKAYFVTKKNGFEYCDGGTVIYYDKDLCIYTRFNGIVKVDDVKWSKKPKVYDPNDDLKLFARILKSWDFVSDPERFAINRIRDRLGEHENSIALIERYNSIWKKYEKDPYKSGEYLERIRSGLKALPKK